VQSPYKPPLGHIASKKSAIKATKALKAPFLWAGLPVFPRSRRLCSNISDRQNIALRLEALLPVTNGMIGIPTRYVLALSRLSPGVRSPLAAVGLGLPVGAASIKLSKLLNQEDALSAPCLGPFILLSAGGVLAGAPMLRTGVIHHFVVTLAFATPKSSGLQAPMSPGGWAADARVERTNARPSSAVVVRRADV
jgi:hypothetical protein